jgi:hypothetical protein
MKFVIGKKYRFSSSMESKLIHEVQGKIFIPIEVHENYTKLLIYNQDGSLMPGPGGNDYWSGNHESSDAWDRQLDFSYSPNPWGTSKIEFKFV